MAALALLSWSGLGAQSGELEWGFVKVWTDPVILPLFGIGATLTVISVLSIVILLDARENAYCVPLERAASLVAGVGGALLLAWFWGLPQPRDAELDRGRHPHRARSCCSRSPRDCRGGSSPHERRQPETNDEF